MLFDSRLNWKHHVDTLEKVHIKEKNAKTLLVFLPHSQLTIKNKLY